MYMCTFNEMGVSWQKYPSPQIQFACNGRNFGSCENGVK
jgi:hypothetical protein